MAEPPINPSLRQLPAGDRPVVEVSPSSSTAASTAVGLSTQLKDMPEPQLRKLAESLGLRPRDYVDKPALVAAVLERRSLVSGLDREGMMEIVVWAGREVPQGSTREQLAIEIAQVKSMRFVGLSHRGALTLALLRGVDVPENATPQQVIELLKRRESLWEKLNRKRRMLMGHVVSRVLGAEQPPVKPLATTAPAPVDSGQQPRPARPQTERPIVDQIEEQGLLGGLTNRFKRTADQYLNQKLDEIEARIDRKLDEIDRRLADWRDKEIANRIRILKISLWATIAVGAATLVISYLAVYIPVLLR